MKKLVIVESPSKSKTIEKYLGSDYKVVASMGHIRDLATTGKFGLGVDVENDFTPSYIPMKGKKKVITDLKKLAKESDQVYLATDPDREGEAISWHLKEALDLKKDYERVTFNEITKDVIIDAFNNARDIDVDLVKSQETRRILDRIIGFRLSKLMQSKTGGKSAGRVQSVALKLIVDREREIQAFIPEEYWSITAKFDKFEADLEKYKSKKIELKNESEADNVISSLGPDYHISNVECKEKNKKGVMPFKTSTLQQTAVNKLNFASSKTMRIAQKLYEGIDIGSETVGLITYMRTDSERLSPVFINEAFKFIKETY
ncbi:MAG: DNA topoisomerase I, partial [Bacilli bacterium]|nr:DNA topoisomerase I [Bacilli bacterium]